jgi:antitoxin component YwqK of YwqJK toxin-antitoxin module
MNLEECETILAAAIKRKACKGNADMAKKYLDAGDVEGFERVCRGNRKWLEDKGIAYVLTDGAAERWHYNGQVFEQFNYLNGRRHGECTWWYPNGQMLEQSNYVGGNRHGKCTCWNSDGRLLEQANYVNGVKQP